MVLEHENEHESQWATIIDRREDRIVDVRTDAGVVSLTGQVPTVGASAKASEMARGVPGVRSVKNELTFTK
jgi:osmotically-inducible protein OsmY